MPEWLWSITVGVVVIGLVAALHRADMNRVEELENWRKSKEEADAKWRHGEYAPTISRINVDLLPLLEKTRSLSESLKDLRNWKHEVIDPYIPRAIDEHERRIDRLDQKVFNGDRR